MAGMNGIREIRKRVENELINGEENKSEATCSTNGAVLVLEGTKSGTQERQEIPLVGEAGRLAKVRRNAAGMVEGLGKFGGKATDGQPC
jgi:hypothetical protein